VKNLWPLPRGEPRFLSLPFRSLAAVPVELSVNNI